MVEHRHLLSLTFCNQKRSFSETILEADQNCSNFSNDGNETNETSENDEDIENFIADCVNNETDLVRNENMHSRAGRSSFNGFKSFCSTRWSCLLSLLKCHLNHFGKLII